jgi:hypothetical protein
MNLSCIECGKRSEGSTGLCATCNQMRRKSARVKPSDNVTPLNKYSKKGADVNRRYLQRLKTWKRGKKCMATFEHDCNVHQGLECHHMGGRSNDAFWDESAEEREVVLTLDERLWMPLCGNAHRYITNNSRWASENGYSFLRITDPVFRKVETITPLNV